MVTYKSDYPDSPVSVYTALRDDPDSTMTTHIGVFSTEDRARDACQEDTDEDWESQRRMQPGVPRPVLPWTDDDDRAALPDGSVYTVILTTLDVRTGMG